jgi:hypothetical protein
MAQEGGASRRAILQAGFGLLAAAGAVRSAYSQQAPKLAKTAVMYQDHPKGNQQCSNCVHFLPPHSCQIVEGEISPNGWCGVFAPKQA